MPRVTRILEDKRRPRRRVIHLDGRRAFACDASLVQKHALAVGRDLSDAEVERLRGGVARQACLSAAVRLLERRMQSRADLRGKLLRRAQWTVAMIDEVLSELERRRLVDDEAYALARARDAAERRLHGRLRALHDLRGAGIPPEQARRAVERTYDPRESLAVARALVRKHAERLRRLDPRVARRRLAGMLARRGFEYDVARPVIDEALGGDDDA